MSIATSDNTKQETIEVPKSLLQKIIDSYENASNTDKTLKHLLDAKMYLSTAEHDLLVSHDKNKAQNDIESSLRFLLEAEKTASTKIKKEVTSLTLRLKALEKITAEKPEIGLDNEVDQLLNEAQAKVLEAKEKSSSLPNRQQRIEDINQKIQVLRKQIAHEDLREDYELSMIALNKIIMNLSK